MTARTVARVFVVAALAWPVLGCPAERRPACAPTSAPYQLPPRAGVSGPCIPHEIVLLRHAEKAAPKGPEDRDPSLSPQGHDRAARIGKLLRRAPITRLIASEYQRTQQTLAPLADRVSRPVDIVPAAHADDLVRELRDAPPGSLTVVASHANVIPHVVTALGGAPLRDLEPDGTLAEDDYARVLLMTVGCSAVAPVVEITSD